MNYEWGFRLDLWLVFDGYKLWVMNYEWGIRLGLWFCFEGFSPFQSALKFIMSSSSVAWAPAELSKFWVLRWFHSIGSSALFIIHFPFSIFHSPFYIPRATGKTKAKRSMSDYFAWFSLLRPLHISHSLWQVNSIHAIEIITVLTKIVTKSYRVDSRIR